MVNAFLLVDGALCEHIRFVLQLSVLVQNFQRTQQTIRAVLFKGTLVAGTVQQSVLGDKLVISGIKLPLQVANLFIGTAI